MKKLGILAGALFLTFSAVSFSATADGTKTKKETKKVALKEHVCTSACSNEKCAYVHGEKGHKCTKDCKK